MSEVKRITLYSAIDSPFPHRVRLALEEAGARYDTIWIDLMNKEGWYEEKVNPAGGKVPLLVYGGRELRPDEAPSAEAVKIPESLVILEFLADLFPDANLLPTDPVLRARIRLWNTSVDAKLPKGLLGFLFLGEPLESILGLLEEFQAMLPPTGFVAGEWSIADAAFIPILARLRLMLETGLGNFTPEVAQAGVEALHSPRFARLQRYYEDIAARPSMSKTWNEVSNLHVYFQCHPAKQVAIAQEEMKVTTVRRMDRFRRTGIVTSDLRVSVPSPLAYKSQPLSR
ncbi:hypothetical protein BN946_scf185002.g9 [Trametes cinnabarina]|uniref:GST N-terminal domain-containing protein n=1 Tax=Pycnoporus cinnabarinus TaxID=5643 RepID=A0A060SKV5_PYCCI|nr:hypothetical protein BN946_scf185002.g9 [Trametes cinnabarina]